MKNECAVCGRTKTLQRHHWTTSHSPSPENKVIVTQGLCGICNTKIAVILGSNDRIHLLWRHRKFLLKVFDTLEKKIGIRRVSNQERFY